MGPRLGNTDMIVDALVIVSVLLVAVLMRKILDIVPRAAKCLFKWKECLSLEYSVRLSRDRNIVYAAFILPLCLTLDRHAPVLPSFMAGLHPALHLLCTGAAFFLYVLLRGLMRRVCRGRRTDPLAESAVYFLFRSAFCLAVPVCLATLGTLTAARCPAEIVNTVIFYEMAVFYVLLLLRQGQILGHYRSLLTTILYLCALEILPAGLVATLLFA